jgi:group II intron maturase/mutator family transposase
VVIASGVTGDGRREVLGFEVGDSEDGAFWTAFLPLAALLDRLAPILRGWTNYFKHGVSKATFNYLRRYTWRRVLLWIRRKHRHAKLEVDPTPLPARVVANGRRCNPVRPWQGNG